MSLAFSSRRSSCSRRTRGGAAAATANHLAYNNEPGLHVSPQEIARVEELNSLQREYLASFNIKPNSLNSNSYDTHSNSYEKYKAQYGRDPVQNATLYSFDVQPKLHSGKVANVNTLKAASKRKILQPNPLKRLFTRSRRQSAGKRRLTRRKATRRL